MCQVPHIVGARSIVRFAFAGLAAALLAGCADSSHFLGDPLSNPFKSASNAPAPSNYDMAPPPPYSPRSPVRSQSLMPPSDMPARRVASYEAPVHQSPRLASDYRAPRTERTASIAAPSGHGSWTAEGGMAVIAANGDTANVLGQRYNVPTDALLHANGLASASEIRPGTRIVIPVYNAGGGGAAPSRVAQAEPPRHEPLRREPVQHDHSSREKLLAKHESKSDDKVARREAERDAKLAKYEKAERDAKDAKLAKIERAEREAKDAKLAKIEKAEHENALRDAKLARAEELKQSAKHQVAEREDAKHEKMHWVKGAQPAKLAKEEKAEKNEKGHGREKAMAKLEHHKEKVETEVAEAKVTKKVAKVEMAREKPMKMAKVEEAPQEAPRKAAPAPVDPEPTASLPPEKASVSSNGNPEFRWPAHGRIIQGFKSGGNDGINIAVPEGTSVKAAEAGTVAYAGSEIKGFGNLVLIRHPNGYVTAYANNGDIEVKRGEQVKRGQTIAKSGQSGNVASPQLHFELRKGSTPVDPTRYLAGL